MEGTGKELMSVKGGCVMLSSYPLENLRLEVTTDTPPYGFAQNIYQNFITTVL